MCYSENIAKMKLPGMSPNAQAVFKSLPDKLSKFFLRYPPRQIQEYAQKPVSISDPTRNPFLATFNEITQKYRSPAYSLREQSDLFKLAEQYGIEKLLPSMNKKFGIQKKSEKRTMSGVRRPKGSKYDNNRPERYV